jgi:hypothetical protein
MKMCLALALDRDDFILLYSLEIMKDWFQISIQDCTWNVALHTGALRTCQVGRRESLGLAPPCK